MLDNLYIFIVFFCLFFFIYFFVQVTNKIAYIYRNKRWNNDTPGNQVTKQGNAQIVTT